MTSLCFQLTINLALVLTHDLLFGKGVKCRDPLKQYVVKHEAELKQYQKALAKDQQRKSDTCMSIDVCTHVYYFKADV